MKQKDSFFYFIIAKSICIFLVSTLLSISQLSGQCGSGMGVTLATQDDVNNFIANHCTDFLGSITIRDDNDGTDDIIDLSPLSTLTSVGSSLRLSNNGKLTNIDGLGSLTSVGDYLDINANFALTNIDGLSSLTSVGDYLWIINNGLLTNINGLGSLTSVGDNLDISLNGKLENIDGLNSLTSVGDYLIISLNFALTNIDGLSSLTSVGNFLDIGVNFMLENIDGLSSLISVGDFLKISGNFKLDSLDDFCGIYTLLDVGGLLGSYNVIDNSFNPSQAEILSNGACSTVSVPWMDKNVSRLLGISPVPSADIVNLSMYSQVNDNLKITITDISGKTVRFIHRSVGEGSHQIPLDISDLTYGVYVVTIISDHIRQARRIIKN